MERKYRTAPNIANVVPCDLIKCCPRKLPCDKLKSWAKRREEKFSIHKYMAHWAVTDASVATGFLAIEMPRERERKTEIWREIDNTIAAKLNTLDEWSHLFRRFFYCTIGALCDHKHFFCANRP